MNGEQRTQKMVGRIMTLDEKQVTFALEHTLREFVTDDLARKRYRLLFLLSCGSGRTYSLVLSHWLYQCLVSLRVFLLRFFCYQRSFH